MSKSAFIDEVEIRVAGGAGGAGIVSFLRERARPHGGPNGGNGGRGGSVTARATTAVNTLSEYRTRRRVQAKNGARGRGSDCNGANAADIILSVPPGTRITDAVSGDLHADLARAGDSAILAPGGRGGFGNAHFKTSVNRTPRIATLGEPGTVREYRLELKLVADVGLLGLPNAGKSTFLRAISAARPKVASYPFTTLQPQLGWVELERGAGAIVVADLPGIIGGAADGAGLGNRFLRHLARAGILCQLVDASRPDAIADCRTVDQELRRASDGALAQKPRWLLLTKTDLLAPTDRQSLAARMHREFPFFERALPISALTGAGIRDCITALLARHAPSA